MTISSTLSNLSSWQRSTSLAFPSQIDIGIHVSVRR